MVYPPKSPLTVEICFNRVLDARSTGWKALEQSWSKDLDRCLLKRDNERGERVKQALYIGNREDLRARSALIRRGMYAGEVLAQFDFPAGFGSAGPSETQHPECFSWHIFSADEFRVIDELPSEVTKL